MLTIVKPGHEIMTPPESVKALIEVIEAAGRTCYKSEDKIKEGSAGKFVASVVRRGHESVIEHGNITVRITCDRSCSHQLVRHRIAAYSQESQRYCDYREENDLEDFGLRVICPPKISVVPEGQYWKDERGIWQHIGILRKPVYDIFGSSDADLDAEAERFFRWLISVNESYEVYKELRMDSVPPEDARSVLPNATKTEVVTTFNLRQWRHVFIERGLNRHAQWQIRGIMLGILNEFVTVLPEVFGDLLEKEGALEAKMAGVL